MDMIFFAHMPKCGGTSVLSVLQESLGDRVVVYYSNPLKRNVAEESIRRLRRMIKPTYKTLQLSDDDVVYGHYSFDEFGPLLKQKDSKTVMFFREPVEWAGSYLSYVGGKHAGLLSGDHLADIKKLRLEQGYRAFLGNVSVQELTCVGLFEEFEQSMAQLERLLGKPMGRRYINKTPKKDSFVSYRDVFEKAGVLSQVEELMSSNFEIYEQAKSQFAKQ